MQNSGKRSAVPVGMESNWFESAEASQHVFVLSLRDLLRIIWQRLWLIVLMAAVGGAAALGYSLMQTPQYEASIRILVGQQQGIISDNPANAAALQQLTRTMTEAIKTRTVTEAVTQELGLQTTPESMLGNLSDNQITQTQFIEVRYRDPDPEKAQQIADAIGDVFSKQVSEASPSTGALTATVWEWAALPTAPVSPKPKRDGFLGLCFGGMLGVGLVFLLDYLDDRWRSPEEVEQISGVPTYGVIPEFKVESGVKKKGE